MLEFPHGGGDWQISHPVDWTVREDDENPDTYIFTSRDGRIRLLLTRRVLTPEIEGPDEDLEQQNLDYGRKLALEMAQAAEAPEPEFVTFANPTCQGFYYSLAVVKPRTDALPYLLGLSATRSRFHMMGYFEFADAPGAVMPFLLHAIGTITCGPAAPLPPRVGQPLAEPDPSQDQEGETIVQA